MATRSSLAAAAEKFGFRYEAASLRKGAGAKLWLGPGASSECGVERAALAHYQAQGWRGYWGEGGLVLNLLKAMSFEQVPVSLRPTYIEAVYAANHAFDLPGVSVPGMLANVRKASDRLVAANFDSLASRKPLPYNMGSVTFTQQACMLDMFPDLEKWMFLELLAAAGNELLHRIATKFAEDPYEYRRGWPDLTLWRGRELLFVEVKAPGDRLGASQKVIAREFAAPFGLDFRLLEVLPQA